MVMTMEEFEKAIIDFATERESYPFNSFSRAFDRLVHYGDKAGTIEYIDSSGNIATISVAFQGVHLRDAWYVLKVSQPGAESQHFAVWGDKWEYFHWRIVGTQAVNGTIYPKPLVTNIQGKIEEGSIERSAEFCLEEAKARVGEFENMVSIANALASELNMEIPGELVRYLPTHPELTETN